MKIQLLGHSTVLVSSKNTQILLDPYFGKLGNLLFKRCTPVSEDYKDIKNLDAILLSHTHWDHVDFKFMKRFKGKSRIFSPRGLIFPLMFKSKSVSKNDEFTIGDFSIAVVQANHVCPAVGYIIKTEERVLYFAGDTYYGKFMRDISKKYEVDIALLPVTNYMLPMTMGEAGAIRSLKDLNPKILIPIHQDIFPRLQFSKNKILISRLNDKIQSENLLTKLIHLKNGESFDTSML